ncbi:MAG: glycosyltransferase family 4 protein [Elusimicrobiales bacterium]
MKILFLLQDVPYPTANGINTRVFNILDALASRGVKCDLLCFGDAGAEVRAAALEEKIPGVKVLAVVPPNRGFGKLLCKILHFLRGEPPSQGEFNSSFFRREFVEAAASAQYDAVHYDMLNMAQYHGAVQGLPSMLSACDAISLSYARTAAETRNPLRRLYLLAAAALIRAYERDIYPRFSQVHVVAGEDAGHLLQVSPETDVEVIPIVVLTDLLEKAPAPEGVPGADCQGRICFAGNLDIAGIRKGLLDFLGRGYPRLRAAFPEVELHILGPKASPRDRREISSHRNVRYFDWVEDYAGFISSADAVIFLDRSGTGIKTRVLEAMGLGRAVVGTANALSGINAVPGEHCLRCEGPEEAADALALLLSNPGLRAGLGKAARALILAEYSVQAVAPRWEELYREAAAAHAAR